MADTLRLEVVTPSRRVLEGRASEVRIPGALGELGVLPDHTPLLTSLGTGEVTWIDGATTGRLVVQGGFAEVQPDVETARTTLAEAQEKLKTVSAEEFDEIDRQVRLAEARINVAAGSST